MNSKTMLLSIAVLTVGLFAMPSTVSLLSGQHAFIAYQGTSNASCIDCHDVVVTGVHNGSNWVDPANATGDWITDKTLTCRGCHVPGAVNTSLRIPANSSSGADGYLTNITATAHIAVRAQCTVCHDTAYTGLKGSDIHKQLNDSGIDTQTNLSWILPSDRACIVCHTQSGISGLDLSALASKVSFNTNVSKYANGTWNVTYSNRT